jgi:signal transduction histidine kinase
MHRLAANETRLEIHGAARTDEIGEMARAVRVFRNNAIDLVESQKALSEQAQTLREALDAERRLTTQQQNFVSMTSHEFRTPLTIIDSHAQRLIRMKDRLEPDALAERARGIRGAVTRMTSLIDSLLNTSRVFDGDVRLHREDIDFAGVVRQACQMHREVALAAQLVEVLEAPVIPVTGDPRLLFQAVSNLISNAIKYSPPGSPIEVEAALEDGAVRVSVSDHGIGIPEKDRAHLFERYFRGSNVSDVAGTGVGLYLVDMVVRLHGGTVAVDSAERGGSRFSMTLPIARARAQPVREAA